MSLPHPVTTASALFDTAFTPAPPAPLAVFDLSPGRHTTGLARSALLILLACNNTVPSSAQQ